MNTNPYASPGKQVVSIIITILQMECSRLLVDWTQGTGALWVCVGGGRGGCLSLFKKFYFSVNTSEL